MPALIRTLMYLAVIGACVAILLPPEVADGVLAARASSMEGLQLAGALATVAGAGLAAWCALAFALVGRGTPLPFDPPRRLVVVGPYRSVRNPMALGVGSALVGVALFYESFSLFLVACLFMLAIHAFVVWYEEPTLRRTFGAEYKAYCAEVDRWRPRRPVPARR